MDTPDNYVGRYFGDRSVHEKIAIQLELAKTELESRGES